MWRGGFLDYINTVASKVIGIEPTETYRREMTKKGYEVYSYSSDAIPHWKEKVDVIVSFDIIEHVEAPVTFIKEAYELLKEGGLGIIGTPTDASVMRELLGAQYESFLFSTQHPWVLGEGSFNETV